MVRQASDPGRTIGELRRAAGMSQAELARRMQTTQSAVARLEAGRLSPSFRTMQKAFEALGQYLEVVARPVTAYEPAPRRQVEVAEAHQVPYGQAALDGVDVSQIRTARRRPPDERLEYLASAARAMRQLLDGIER